MSKMLKLKCTDCDAFVIIPEVKSITNSQMIIDKCCTFLGISFKDLKSRRKFTHLVRARYLVWHVLYSNARLRMTKKYIGFMFNRDHSTVISGLNELNNWISYDKELQNELKNLHDYVYGHFDYLARYEQVKVTKKMDKLRRRRYGKKS